MPINQDPKTIPGAPVPPWWQSGEPSIQRALDEIKLGEVKTVARSPGGRPVRAVFYGQPEPHLRGTANWNSALGARQPDSFVDRGNRPRPVLVVLAGVHGQEMEGMIGALSLLKILESGLDLAGQPQPELREKGSALRLIVIPLANPDGRARCPDGGWVGRERLDMTRIGQGTRRDGSLYGWPGCKAVHPMRGDVGLLGAYFDDNGVNLMHDSWHAPMSETTSALLNLVQDEAPDMLLNLHSCQHPPFVLPLPYAPLSTKQALSRFAEQHYAALAARGIVHGGLPSVDPDGPPGQCPPSFSLTSMCFHAGALLPLTIEGPHGFVDARVSFDYETILTLYHVLFQSAAEWLAQK